MAKATHQGECQVCGRFQKLPAGLLAKHGYSVDWGFFNGICPGAGHPPLELAKDLVDGAIARAQDQMAALNRRIEHLEQPAPSLEVTAHVYRDSRQCRRREKPGYLWVAGTLAEREPRHGYSAVVVTPDGTEYYVPGLTRDYGPTLLDTATYHNRQFAKELARHVRQLADYIRWQQRRLTNWAPRSLTPLAP